MKKFRLLGGVAIVVAAGSILVGMRPSAREGVATFPDGSARLANGWKITPAGRHVGLPGDMPGSIVVAPGGRFAFVNTCGYHGHSIDVVEIATASVVQKLDVGVNWVGMAYDAARRELYVSGGSPAKFGRKAADVSIGEPYGKENLGAVLRLGWDGSRLTPKAALAIADIPEKDQFVSGISTLRAGGLAVVNIQNDTVYRLSPENRETTGSVKVGYRPYAVAESPSGNMIAVSNWGAKSVSLIDATTWKITATVPVGVHPNALTYGKDGRLFVASASDNRIDVITGEKRTESIRVSLSAADKIGSAPNALSLSPDGKTLYCANADNNSIAVIDISGTKSKVQGFFPTGRFPSAVAATPDGKTILIGTGKAMGPSASFSPERLKTFKGTPQEARNTKNYIGDLLTGTLSIVAVPSSTDLKSFTAQVKANRPTAPAVPKGLLAAMRKIKHVVYVLRENRTYDQVFGDLPQGNGEPRLVMFGEEVTPNSHALVQRYGLMDNLYSDGETSQVGHQWAGAAYATDFNEKNWILGYSNRTQIAADPRLNSSPAGYLSDNVQRHGKTSRIYGEYVKWQEDHDSAKGEVKADPEKFGCSAAFEEVFARGGRDTEKVDVFLKEMRAYEAKGNWPNFMLMALPEDHTEGLRPGHPTPEACVANNDQAIGRLIEGISRSKFWAETAIFIIQDDAQDGPDHVDARRTVGLVVSPYCKRGIVDRTHYSTSSMIHTMQLILGIPTMTQYDTAATPMTALFTEKPNFEPWTNIPAKIDVNKMNPSSGKLAERSMKLDFSEVDKADWKELNAILWEWRKPGQPMPKPVYRR